jgi:hypothetical protein
VASGSKGGRQAPPRGPHGCDCTLSPGSARWQRAGPFNIAVVKMLRPMLQGRRAAQAASLTWAAYCSSPTRQSSR